MGVKYAFPSLSAFKGRVVDFVLKEIIDTIMTARAAHRPLFIRGGGSKDFYGEPAGLPDMQSRPILDMSAFNGIVNYQPSELVITARAGTLLSDIEQVLDEHGQMLAFEPPRLASGSTIGGCVASGLSGPRRVTAGKVSDFLLGAKLLNSSGELLRFGGEVMKNVAGYDVSRLLAGSMGILGPLTEVSLKVVPKPFSEVTVELMVDQAQALTLTNTWRGLPLPISATCWEAIDASTKGRLRVRLSGNEPAVRTAQQRVGGVTLDGAQASAYWASLRDQTHPFFRATSLWRVAIAPSAAPLQAGPTLIEWQGGQRWLSDVDSAPVLRAQVAAASGHATWYRHPTSHQLDLPVFHPLPKVLMDLNRRVKQQLDPEGIFNPKRLFTEL
jgi:glycolate oxidase FAD binding subunit